MLKSKGFLFCASIALSCAIATAATTITPEQPEYKNGCYQISTMLLPAASSRRTS